MKIRLSCFAILFIALLQVLVFAGDALAYDISGTVVYGGPKTGRVFITAPNTQYGTLGTSVVFSASVPFTIRGIQNGTYDLNAFMNTQNDALRRATDPVGSTSGVTVNNGNVPGVVITLTDPVTPPTPDQALPTDVGVVHGTGADMVTWSTDSDNGLVPADSYNLYWSTNPDVMNHVVGSKTNIPASNDKSLFINAGSYHYAMKSVVNGVLSTSFSSGTETTTGAGYTISGQVSLSGGNPVGTPLVVVLVPNKAGPVNFVTVTTTATPQPFTITGVQDGEYLIFPVFDMNANGLLDTGDIMPNDSQAGHAQVVGGNVNAGTISFSASNVNAGVMTNHWKGNGNETYNLGFNMNNNTKTAVKVTFTGGTNMPPGTVIDAGLSNDGGFSNWVGVPWTPQVGDAYTADVTYSDASGETITMYVTGVLSSFPTPVSPIGVIPYGSGMPVFNWSAPSSPPTDYTYSLMVGSNNGGNVWNTNNGLPSTQLTADYNFDNNASQSALTNGQTYWWQISVQDLNRNSASVQSVFTYAGALSGTVTNGATGIQNVFVSVCKYNAGTCDWNFNGPNTNNGTNTDTNGNYAILGLPTGQYKVFFNGGSLGYISQWYNNKTDESTADTVAVTSGSMVTGINAALATGGVYYTLTINTAGTGTGQVSGAGSYLSGSTPGVNAMPAPGSSFTGWSGNCSGTNPSTSVFMDGPKTCIATFTLTASASSKIGVFSDGNWYLDANQSWSWDGTPTDIQGVFGLGVAGAIPVVGDWNGDGKTKIGIFVDGVWYLDMNGNGVWDGEGIDVRGVFGAGLPNAIPVTGDWNGDGITEIGIYSNGNWYLDTNRNWAWDGPPTDTFGVFGIGLPNAIPVTGDWNGDGTTKIGIYSDGNWYLDTNRNWAWDGPPTDTFGSFGLGLPNAIPVTGDWNGDGITEIGIYSNGNWYLDKNRSWAWEGTPTDTFGVFGIGLPNAVPVVGKW